MKQTPFKSKPPKRRKCKYCQEWFQPHKAMLPFCSPMCETIFKAQEPKKKRQATARKELDDFNWNDKKWLKVTAQKDINKYARLRDFCENGLRCVTCNSTTGKRDGGHFLPTSGFSAIRYNTNQIHQQCVNCNQYNGGRRPEYTEFMIIKYGQEYVEALESMKNVIRPYSVEYYQRLIKIVRIKTKKVEKRIASRGTC